MKNVYYVYVYFRLTGEPCYVGKGSENRFMKHLTRETNAHLRSIIKQAGGDLPRVIIRNGLSERDAFATEIALIKAIGREAHGGPLVNLTDGGEGPSGMICSDETRSKISTSLKAIWADEDLRRQQSAAQIEIWSNPDARESRESIIKKWAELFWTEEKRAERSEKTASLWQDDGWRNSVIQASQTAADTEECKLKKYNGAKKRWDEFRSLPIEQQDEYLRSKSVDGAKWWVSLSDVEKEKWRLEQIARQRQPGVQDKKSRAVKASWNNLSEAEKLARKARYSEGQRRRWARTRNKETSMPYP